MRTVSGISNFKITNQPVVPKTKAEVASPKLKAQAPKAPSDQVHLGNSVAPEALITKKTLPNQSLPKSEPVSTTAAKEEPEELTNWILESANSTPYANSEHIGLYRERMPRFPKDMRASFDEALLNAIATNEVPEGQSQLKALSSTMKWSLKFKKDASKVHSESGFVGLRKAALAAEAQSESVEKSPLDKILASDTLLFDGKLPRARAAEADKLLTQHLAGNENPGIGNKTLGKGVCYLRGRKGTRIFYRQKDGKTEWLAVCDKSNEPKAIAILRKELDLR